MVETDYKKVPIEDKDCEKEGETFNHGYGVRHVQCLIYFLCLTLCYATRGHLGVSIVAMTHLPSKSIDAKINTTLCNEIDNNTNECNASIYRELNYSDNNTNEAKENDTDMWTIYRTYDWPKATQEMVLGGFFLGYSIMMFPMGMVSQKYGGKLPLQIALFVNAFLSFFAPWIVAWSGWKGLSACRIMQGMTQAGLYPGMLTLLANWVPVSERGRLSSNVFTGSGFGTVIAFQLGGVLAYSRFGWPSTFWVLGICCLAVFFLLTFYGAASPGAHYNLSLEEKRFIEGGIEKKKTIKSTTPWKAILTTVPIWATFVAHAGSALTFVFFYTQVPTYINAILKINLRENGILSSLPYISTILATILFGYLSDFFTNKKIITLKTARQLSNTAGSIFLAICVVLVSYTTDIFLAVTYFIISLGTNGAMHTGWMVNYMDLSPNYSGALMSFGNTIANVFILTIPVMVSNIVTDVTNQTQWRIMMYLISGVTIVSNFVFVIFMAADVQPWNSQEETNKTTDADGIDLAIQTEMSQKIAVSTS